MRKRIPVEVRIARRLAGVEPDENGCIDWPGARTAHGYGVAGTHDAFGPTLAYVHRVRFEEVNGPIPDGQVIRHKCDRPCCTAIEHLEIGSQADNARDAVERGRIQTGERSPSARLTDKKVLAICERYDAGERVPDIAREYGVSESLVYLVLQGERWAHITGRGRAA